jgi:type IV pilus assembly protein PilF
MSNPTYGGGQDADDARASARCVPASAPRPSKASCSPTSWTPATRSPATTWPHLLYERGELTRAQFYIRRINNSDLANAESLWLGIKVERKLNNRESVLQLGEQLKKRFAQSREAAAYEKGSFNE